jgi:prolipoprotein diacylglyceryltransferase
MGERMFKYEKLDLKWLESLFIYLIVATIVGARLGHVFFYGWDYYSKHPLELYRFGTVAWRAMGVLWVFSCAYLLEPEGVETFGTLVLDRVVVQTALVAALIRTGNLMNSEIYGVPTNLPWDLFS